MNDGVCALVFDKEGNLYTGGDFTMVGGKPSTGIALWHANSSKMLGRAICKLNFSAVRAILIADTSAHLENVRSELTFSCMGNKIIANKVDYQGKRCTIRKRN